MNEPDKAALSMPNDDEAVVDAIRDMVEAVAADVHAAWMDTKRAQGITSRLSSDGIEQMVPYNELPDHLQELDRSTVRAVLASPTLQRSLRRPAGGQS